MRKEYQSHFHSSYCNNYNTNNNYLNKNLLVIIKGISLAYSKQKTMNRVKIVEGLTIAELESQINKFLYELFQDKKCEFLDIRINAPHHFIATIIYQINTNE